MKRLLFTLLLTLPTLAAGDQYDRRLIHTNGYGEVKAAPDMARLSLSVQVTRKAALDAKTEVDRRVNKLLDALKKHGIKEKDIIASGLHTNPQYEYSKLSSKHSFVGYNATRTLNITVRQLGKLTDVMDLALKNDIQNIGHISYESSEKDKHLNQARKNAIANSKQKAQALAQAYDAELGAIVSIRYHNRQAGIAQPDQAEASPRMARAMFSSTPAQPATYLPDEITFSDNIQVTFDLIVNN